MRHYLDALLTRQGMLLVAGNALPLLGVLLAGWDAPTLVILYWMETAILGFWVLVRVTIRPPEVAAKLAGTRGARPNGLGIGLFILAHAGIFMFVHLFILGGVMPGVWQQHLSSPMAFISGFVIPTGLWWSLAGLFVAHGLVTFEDMRAGLPADGAVVGLYIRIFVMQLAILLGGMLSLLLGSHLLLALLIVVKTGLEIWAERAGASIAFRIGKAAAERDG